jgi:dolichol-phosphate mannosyltransferase
MKICVIIPCFEVKNHILGVIDLIGDEVSDIVVVDDLCPQSTGKYVESSVEDKRVKVIYNKKNLGVGGAVKEGYKYALSIKTDICVKVDGDGQMDPTLIPSIVKPILKGKTDYVKGNRFYSLYDVKSMPKTRFFGNTILGFLTKLSSGYWSIFDPTNGFTAIHSYSLSLLPLHDISNRYFFETDMLISLGGIRAKVIDMPMRAVYGDEVSGLKVRDIFFEFSSKHIRSIARRVLYSYFFRDFSLASIHLPTGALLLLFGVIFGANAWYDSVASGTPASTGTVFLSALPILLGVQFLLSFLSFDILNEPSSPLQDHI